MCGIAGIYNKDDTPADRGMLERMTRSMVHRGPDADGHFLDGPVGLGHRRLRIIDLEGGRQPLFNEDGSVVVSFNGEIYNYRDLHTELAASGHTFSTHSDTEVIVHAFEQYGVSCPERLRGMFAFAVYDRKSRRLLLARDRVGIKPLYYWEDDQRFLFASEVKAILSALDSRPGVNTSVLDFYVSLGYVPGEETLFHGIRKLAPGHTLLLAGGKAEIRRYWDLGDSAPQEIGFPEASARLEELLRECVASHLMSDVPLGAFLSGGVDSSAVVALMSSMSSEPVKTFCVGYEDDPSSSELSWARRVADRFNTRHHEFILKPLDFFESMDLLLEHAEEPVVESAAVALYRLSLLAKEHVTVILSGEGGDEALAGYPLHRLMQWVDRVHGVLRFAPPALLDTLTPLAARTEKSLKYWDWARVPLRQRYAGISNDVTSSIKARMYSGDWSEASRRTQAGFTAMFDALPASTPLRRMAVADIRTWLPDDLLLKADKMTMAASLELRVPFLDHVLLEYCTSLPDDYRLHRGQGKYILKKVMEKYLPPEIIYRRKRGFPVPIAAWFRGPLHERTREILLDSSSVSRGYFRRDYVEAVLARHRDGREDLSRRIFSLLNLELWHQKYVD